MKIVGNDGQMFQMNIVGYQFPHLGAEEHDSNWLVIAGEVAHPRGSWQFKDPCLLTYEGEHLASWMEAIAAGKALPSNRSFIEPNIEFRALVAAGYPVLRVYFELESRPEWAVDEELWVEFSLADLDLKSIARQWRADLGAYPQRAQRKLNGRSATQQPREPRAK
jgi:hypothetical protein